MQWIGELDLTKRADCEKMTALAVERFGRIDGVVNLVGGFRLQDVSGDSLETWQAMLRLNGDTAFNISAAVLPALREAGFGRIVHVAANAAFKANRGQAAYAASKAAVLRLTEALAAENRKFGITANSIVPGIIDTPANRAAMPDADVGEWTSPSSIAKVIAFLVSEHSAAITGAAVNVSGRA
jgi:NAD(P)-dependent dehydrogenase (short-subunit alcohol dehydrogenase family)